jgi:hypothetical protein
MKVVPISQDDVTFIEEEIKPKNKRGLIYFTVFFIIFSVLAPFLPGRNVHVTSFSSADYFTGFLFYAGVAVLIVAFIYYKSVYCLNKDLQEGEKLVLQLKVLRKGKNRYAQNELILQRPKSPSFDKILLPNEHFYDWHAGDIAIVEVLVRSGTVLSFEKY